MGNACRKGQTMTRSSHIRDLFEACEQNPPRVERIRSMVAKRPYLVRYRQQRSFGVNANGHYALFVAISRDAPIEVVSCLVQAWPDSVKLSPFSRVLPLHKAASTSSLEVVQFLFDQWPDAIRKKTTAGSLPLHWAIDSNTLDVVNFLVAKWTHSVRLQDNLGLPLHHAIRTAARPSRSLDVVRYLVDTWPEAIGIPGRWSGKSPLDLCVSQSSSDVGKRLVKVLLHGSPASSHEHLRKGCFALHQAARQGSLPVLQLLCEAWPPGARQVTPDGNLPLHCYLKWHYREPEVKCVQYLVTQYPDSVICKNGQEQVPIQLIRQDSELESSDLFLPLVDRHQPLHFISMYSRHIPNAVLTAILHRHAYAAAQTDENGWLPWQLASSQRGASLSLVYQLLRLCPETLRSKDPSGQ